MSLITFEKMLEDLDGVYEFNFANEDDCAYLLEEYGGEERMKTCFPAIYESFLKARGEAVERVRANKQAESGTFMGDMENAGVRYLNTLQSNDDDPAVVLTTAVSGMFIDNTLSIESGKDARPWLSVTVQSKIRERYSPEYLIYSSDLVNNSNSYAAVFESNPEVMSRIKNKHFQKTIEIAGIDPSGKLRKGVIQGGQDMGDPRYPTIANITITDPAPKNDLHKANNQIVMLYGRMSEQEFYKDADYKGGDYLKNAFANNKVRLLIPMSGSVLFDYKVKPLELHKPKGLEKLTRSEATYEYLEQKFLYRDNIDDVVLYNQLKDCFTCDEYKENHQTKVTFDIKAAVENYSDLDWLVDVNGLPNGDPKTIYIIGKFSFDCVNQKEGLSVDQIKFKSVSKEDLKKFKAEYYTYAGGNIVYIPPITVYWGCFGRDVQLRLAGKREKPASEVKIGDRLLGLNHEILTVNNVYTGYDTEIFEIVTQSGNTIRVSGGHPMMCGGKMVRASRLNPGDCLNTADGASDPVEQVSVVSYEDTVYNFTFEGKDEGAYLIANGLYSGDLFMQNTKENQPRKVREFNPEEKRLMEEMAVHNEELKAAHMQAAGN